MRLQYDEVKEHLSAILKKYNYSPETADMIADVVAENSLEGIYTHGINRFAWLINTIKMGIVNPNAQIKQMAAYGALESYDGDRGLGIPNAIFCIDRAVALAGKHGVGCVVIRNTNHWLRAATYAYRACKAGMAAICFTNTIANMPTWGAVDARLGNNPIVFAYPRDKGDIVCDMAMSQFSYGALELASLEKRQMPIDAGYDKDGNLTRDPDLVIESKRLLPTGYWKGAALSNLLDIFAAATSLGNTVADIASIGSGTDQSVSQFFLALNVRSVAPQKEAEEVMEKSLAYLLNSIPANPAKPIIYTGQIALDTREYNEKHGIPVDEKVWEEVLRL